MNISVIISVYNGEAFIAETIASIMAQGDCIHEVIVADDHSTDDTRKEALSIGDERVRVITASRKGLPAGRNCGVEVATGDWLYFVDADDLVRPGALNSLLEAAKLNPQAGYIYGDYDRITHEGNEFGRRHHFMRYRRKPSGNVLENIMQNNFTVVGAQIVKRSVYDKVGGFDESLKVSDDWNFWCRAAAVTEFLFVPGLYIMSYRLHNSSIMHQKPLSFEAFKPGIESVFTNPVIAAKLSEATLKRLKKRREASVLSYIASIAVRLKYYNIAIKTVIKAIIHSPWSTPRTLMQFGGSFVGL